MDQELIEIIRNLQSQGANDDEIQIAISEYESEKAAGKMGPLQENEERPAEEYVDPLLSGDFSSSTGSSEYQDEAVNVIERKDEEPLVLPELNQEQIDVVKSMQAEGKSDDDIKSYIDSALNPTPDEEKAEDSSIMSSLTDQAIKLNYKGGELDLSKDPWGDPVEAEVKRELEPYVAELEKEGEARANEQFEVPDSFEQSATRSLLNIYIDGGVIDDRLKWMTGRLIRKIDSDNEWATEAMRDASAEIKQAENSKFRTLGFTDDVPEDMSWMEAKLSALFDVTTQFGYSAAKLSAGPVGSAVLWSEIASDTVRAHNEGEAERKGVTVDELIEKGEADLALPAITSIAMFGLERIGFKGLTKQITKMNPGAIRTASEYLYSIGTEGLTEWTQGALEVYNEEQAKDGSHLVGLNKAADFMFSKEGLETLLSGFGAAPLRGVRDVRKAISNRRTPESTETALKTGAEINELELSKKHATASEMEVINNSIENLKSTQKEAVEQPYRDLSNVNKADLEKINGINDKIVSLHKNALSVEDSPNLNNEQKQIVINDIDAQISALTAEANAIVENADKVQKSQLNKVKEAPKAVVDAYNEERENNIIEVVNAHAEGELTNAEKALYAFQDQEAETSTQETPEVNITEEAKPAEEKVAETPKAEKPKTTSKPREVKVEKPKTPKVKTSEVKTDQAIIDEGIDKFRDKTEKYTKFLRDEISIEDQEFSESVFKDYLRKYKLRTSETKVEKADIDKYESGQITFEELLSRKEKTPNWTILSSIGAKGEPVTPSNVVVLEDGRRLKTPRKINPNNVEEFEESMSIEGRQKVADIQKLLNDAAKKNNVYVDLTKVEPSSKTAGKLPSAKPNPFTTGEQRQSVVDILDSIEKSLANVEESKDFDTAEKSLAISKFINALNIDSSLKKEIKTAFIEGAKEGNTFREIIDNYAAKKKLIISPLNAADYQVTDIVAQAFKTIDKLGKNVAKFEPLADTSDLNLISNDRRNQIRERIQLYPESNGQAIANLDTDFERFAGGIFKGINPDNATSKFRSATKAKLSDAQLLDIEIALDTGYAKSGIIQNPLASQVIVNVANDIKTISPNLDLVFNSLGKGNYGKSYRNRFAINVNIAETRATTPMHEFIHQYTHAARFSDKGEFTERLKIYDDVTRETSEYEYYRKQVDTEGSAYNIQAKDLHRAANEAGINITLDRAKEITALDEAQSELGAQKAEKLKSKYGGKFIKKMVDWINYVLNKLHANPKKVTVDNIGNYILADAIKLNTKTSSEATKINISSADGVTPSGTPFTTQQKKDAVKAVKIKYAEEGKDLPMKTTSSGKEMIDTSEPSFLQKVMTQLDNVNRKKMQEASREANMQYKNVYEIPLEPGEESGELSRLSFWVDKWVESIKNTDRVRPTKDGSVPFQYTDDLLKAYKAETALNSIPRTLMDNHKDVAPKFFDDLGRAVFGRPPVDFTEEQKEIFKRERNLIVRDLAQILIDKKVIRLFKDFKNKDFKDVKDEPYQMFVRSSKFVKALMEGVNFEKENLPEYAKPIFGKVAPYTSFVHPTGLKAMSGGQKPTPETAPILFETLNKGIQTPLSYDWGYINLIQQLGDTNVFTYEDDVANGELDQESADIKSADLLASLRQFKEIEASPNAQRPVHYMQKVDNRGGRFNVMVRQLNYQSNPLNKFTTIAHPLQWKPIGKEGYEALVVQLVDEEGKFLGQTWDERLAYGLSIVDDYIAKVRKFKKNKDFFAKMGKKSFGVVATALELSRADKHLKDNGDLYSFPSGRPIGYDYTTSQMQVMSALTDSRKSGTTVNLNPEAADRGDHYLNIGEIAWKPYVGYKAGNQKQMDIAKEVSDVLYDYDKIIHDKTPLDEGGYSDEDKKTALNDAEDFVEKNKSAFQTAIEVYFGRDTSIQEIRGLSKSPSMIDLYGAGENRTAAEFRNELMTNKAMNGLDGLRPNIWFAQDLAQNFRETNAKENPEPNSLHKALRKVGYFVAKQDRPIEFIWPWSKSPFKTDYRSAKNQHIKLNNNGYQANIRVAVGQGGRIPWKSQTSTTANVIQGGDSEVIKAIRMEFTGWNIDIHDNSFAIPAEAARLKEVMQYAYNVPFEGDVALDIIQQMLGIKEGMDNSHMTKDQIAESQEFYDKLVKDIQFGDLKPSPVRDAEGRLIGGTMGNQFTAGAGKARPKWVEYTKPDLNDIKLKASNDFNSSLIEEIERRANKEC